jgi:Mor family transcriptional regulator
MALPPVIGEIIRLIGHGKAMALVHEFGGQNLRFPKGEGGDLWAALAEVIGEHATKALCAALGGEEVYIAFCLLALKQDRNRKMISRYEKLIKQGHTSRGAVSVLVREHKLSYRQIEKIINAPMPEPSTVALQAQLF